MIKDTGYISQPFKYQGLSGASYTDSILSDIDACIVYENGLTIFVEVKLTRVITDRQLKFYLQLMRSVRNSAFIFAQHDIEAPQPVTPEDCFTVLSYTHRNGVIAKEYHGLNEPLKNTINKIRNDY